MQRRMFISGLGATIASCLLIASAAPACAQTPNRVYRLGHLGSSLISEASSREQILPELAKLGFVVGRNLIFDARVGEQDAQSGLMRELLAAQPDAVIVIGSALLAAGAATRTVPIVTFGTEPVELGLAQSYARPGGNVTGVVFLTRELEAKRLSILHEAVPDRRRVAALFTSAAIAVSEPPIRAAAASLGLELLAFTAATPADYPAAFAAMRAAGAQALIIGASPEFRRDGKQLASLALDAQLPTVCQWAEMAHVGCLIAYGPKGLDLRKRMAHQIAAIFRGEPPANIPIELPTRFEFALNQNIAKTLGLTIPTSVLLRADEVIE